MTYYIKTQWPVRNPRRLFRHNPSVAGNEWDGASEGMPVRQLESLLEQAVIDLYQSNPLYAYVLMGMPRLITKKYQGHDFATAAVSWDKKTKKHYLIWNPDFLVFLPPKHRIGVLAHELGHIINKHTTRFPKGPGNNHYFFNLAADCIVNFEVIENLGSPDYLPDFGFLLDKQFPDLMETSYAGNYTVEQIYNRMMQIYRQEEQKVKLEEKNKGITNPFRRNPEDSPISRAAIRGMIEKGREEARKKGGDPGNPDDWTYEGSEHGHDHDADAEDGEDAIEREEDMRARIRQAAKRLTEAQASKLTGALKEYVDDLFKPTPTKPIDWRQLLRRFAANASRTKLRNTMTRPSKRFGTFPSTKIKQLLSIVVLVDTSGSVGEEVLKEFFAQIDYILRRMPGTEITVLLADTEVYDHYKHRLGTRPGLRPGGTSFAEPLRWLKDSKIKYDAAIYLTDGGSYDLPGADPSIKPKKLLWVVSNKTGMGSHLLWGPQIYANLD